MTTETFVFLIFLILSSPFWIGFLIMTPIFVRGYYTRLRRWYRQRFVLK